MSEKSFTAVNKNITLDPVDSTLVVKYKKKVNNKKALDIMSTKKSANLDNTNVQTYPKYNISIVTRPFDEQKSTRQTFADSLAEDDEVEFVSPIYKDKDTGSLVVVTDQVNVEFKKEADKQTIDKILSEHDLSIIKQSKFSPQNYILKVNNADSSDKTIEISKKLSSRPELQYANPITLRQLEKYTLQIPVGKYFQEQWHLHNTGQDIGTPGEDVKALEAWEITKGNPEIKIGVVDDGLSYTHYNINIWENPDSQAQDKYGYDFANDEPDPKPKSFSPPYNDTRKNDIHGTPCAGVICAKGEPKSGVHGIAPECKVIGIKIVNGGDFAGDFDIGDAIRYAGKFADVISCSWGGGPPTDEIVSAIRDVVTSGRNGKGCPIFFATGNFHPFRRYVSFPANLPETIAVGASTNEGKRAGYSQFGPEIDFLSPSDGGTKGIFTTDVPDPNRGYNLGNPSQGDPEGFYTNEFGGTSSATPLAAGIGALLLSINPDLTAEQVRQIMRETCDKIDPNNANYDSNGFSKSHGYGRVNAKSALEKAKEMV